MTAPREGGEVDREDADSAPEPTQDDATEELDAFAYESLAHGGSVVPRSLLDFLR